MRVCVDNIRGIEVSAPQRQVVRRGEYLTQLRVLDRVEPVLYDAMHHVLLTQQVKEIAQVDAGVDRGPTKLELDPLINP